MTILFSLVACLIAGIPVQATEPTIEMLRASAQERMRQDLAVYSAEDFRKIEDLYQPANKNLRAPEAKTVLQRVVKEYPKSNRAGACVLYLAQMTSEAEREAYLKTAIETYGDTWYGDGVQVGAFARAQLAVFYSVRGRMAEARALAKEVVDRFPGAVDHSGHRLADMLAKMKLL